MAGIPRKKQSVRPDQHRHRCHRMSRAVDRLDLNTSAKLEHPAILQIQHADVSNSCHRLRIVGKAVLFCDACALFLSIMNCRRNPLLPVQVNLIEAVHSATVVIMPVRQHNRKRKCRQRSDIRRDVSDAAARIDQKRPVLSLHKVHILRDRAADSCNMCRHPLRGKIHWFLFFHLSLPLHIISKSICIQSRNFRFSIHSWTSHESGRKSAITALLTSSPLSVRKIRPPSLCNMCSS